MLFCKNETRHRAPSNDLDLFKLSERRRLGIGLINSLDRSELCRIAGIREPVAAEQAHQIDIRANIRWRPDRLVARMQEAVR